MGVQQPAPREEDEHSIKILGSTLFEIRSEENFVTNDQTIKTSHNRNTSAPTARGACGLHSLG
jgi:hypothetical protein